VKNTFSKSPFRKDSYTDVLPRFTRVSSRKADLGIAGLAFVAGGVGGPTAAFAGSHPSPAQSPNMVAVADSTPIKDAPKDNKDATAPAKNAPSAKALKYDYKRQPNFYYCGPAATRIALTALGHTNSFDDVAKKLHTTVDGTNSANDTTRVLNQIDGGDFYKTHEISGKTATKGQITQLKSDVVHAVGNDHPVVANIAGTISDTSGRTHSYEGGHYLTIVGYANGASTVKIADPADTKGNGSYWVHADTMANWIATRGYSA
jgi:hypothetical protein